MFMYSNPIVVHRIFYLCKILQDLLPKPLLLTILLTSQAIELESTSKNVSFNALTSTSLDCMVAFSLVVVLTCQQQYFWRWMATMKDEICLLFWIIHPTRKLRFIQKREQFHSKIGFVPAAKMVFILSQIWLFSRTNKVLSVVWCKVGITSLTVNCSAFS